MIFTLRKKEILIDILVRLPVKSLVRFMRTCKSWRDLIGSSSFISKHLNSNVSKHAHVYLLCLHYPNFERQNDTDDPNVKEDLQWSIFSHETFEQCSKLSHPLGSPENYVIYGSSNGLVCISDEKLNVNSPIYIWNPSVRKFRTLPISSNKTKFVYVALQFGFHPGVNDYMVVRMMRTMKGAFAIEVYSLRTDYWKMIEPIPHWLNCTWQHYKGTFSNGVAYHVIDRDPRFSIISFDSGTEEFTEIVVPDVISRPQDLCIDVYKEQVCLLLRFYDCEEEGMDKVDLWVLQEKQWKEMSPFTFPLGDGYYGLIGIGIDNELLMQRRDYIKGGADLCSCRYQSRQILDTGIKLAILADGDCESFFSNIYTESLVLLHNYLTDV